jgi:glycosyltransferase involved in cell wall biosynthesis
MSFRAKSRNLIYKKNLSTLTFNLFMRILNSMFGKGLGGIEQAFLDYTESLAMLGHEVICVVRPGAKVIFEVQKLKQKYPAKITLKKVFNLNKYDPVAKYFLGKILKKYFPDAVIVHGNRPASLFSRPTKKHGIPMIGVVHNYWFKDILKADFLFCVSTDIRSKIIAHWFGNNKVFRVPNLIRVGAEPEFKPRSNPVVIGTMARMVDKKGIDIFIKACAILKNKGFQFKAVIGGDGEQRYKMQSLRDELKLNGDVKFIGWVKDKEKFYNDIDIFCLPSLSEPFGIVLLEAMIHKKPIVSTNIEGPAEILHNDLSAVMVDRGSSEKLAEGLEKLINDREKSLLLAEKGFWSAKNVYDISVVAKTLESTLEEVISKA